MKALIAFTSAAFFATSTFAAEYFCPVSFKQSTDGPYTAEQLQKWTPTVRVSHIGNSATISRCSFTTSAGAVTCDDYQADFIHKDRYGGHTKYYYYRGQLDVQIFSDLNFIENNGRGSVAFG